MVILELIHALEPQLECGNALEEGIVASQKQIVQQQKPRKRSRRLKVEEALESL